jgi:hypothetical protein
LSAEPGRGTRHDPRCPERNGDKQDEGEGKCREQVTWEPVEAMNGLNLGSGLLKLLYLPHSVSVGSGLGECWDATHGGL